MEFENKEMQLEQVAERAIKNAQQLNLAPPIFELYAALLAMSLAVIMFLIPGLLEMEGGLYVYLDVIAPQEVWALSFFTAGVTTSLGMLCNKIAIRIIGLSMLTALFGTLTVIYGLLLPNFGFILMLWITIFTIASIPLTRYTGIWNK